MSRLSDNIRCDGSDVGRGCGCTGKDHPQSLPDDGLPTPCGDFSREFCVILTIDELGLEIDVGSWGCSEGNLAGTYNVRTCKHGAGKIDRVGIDHRGRVIATKNRAVICDSVDAIRECFASFGLSDMAT